MVGCSEIGAAFSGGTDVDACVDVAVRVNRLADQAFTIFAADGGGPACRSGCSFCCHLRVMVRPHEAIALYRQLGAGIAPPQAAQVRRRVLENAAHIARLGARGHAAARIACAFLVDGTCSAYAARPLACASYHSLDRRRCELNHVPAGASDAETGIPVLQGLAAAAALLEEGVDAALAQRNLDSQCTELHTAIAALIRKPALIARWRSGRILLPPARD